MEVSAIRHLGAAGAHGRSPLLRVQSDERLVSLIRRGNHHAFEALVSRYQSRLLAFCRHMLSSREDAEDVLQEVFAAAFNAMLADDRPINVRPWLYRIARNRSLNHLRRTQAVGVDSMDTHLAEHGLTTADKAHRREDFRLLIADVRELPESQRTALLLREIDALSYEQIAEAMENTVPSVKSLLVRARVGLAEAAEARLLDCDVVRFELGEVAEGLKRMSPPVRRHVRTCEPCTSFRRQLVDTNRQLAALLPVGPLLILKKTLLAQLGTAAAASGAPAAAGSAAGGALQLTFNAAAGKAAAGLAAAAIVTAGAVEVKHVAVDRGGRPAVVATASSPSSPSSSPSPSPATAGLPGSGSAIAPPAAVPALERPAATASPDPVAPDENRVVPGEPAASGEPTEGAGGAEGGEAAREPEAGEASPAPILMADAPLVAASPADPRAKPLGTPLTSTPAASPPLVEGVVQTAAATAGTPVTGVVRANAADKPAQPVVEALPPAVVSEPVLDGSSLDADSGEPPTGDQVTAPTPAAPTDSPAPAPPVDVPAAPVPADEPEVVAPSVPEIDADPAPDPAENSPEAAGGDGTTSAPGA